MKLFIALLFISASTLSTAARGSCATIGDPEAGQDSITEELRTRFEVLAESWRQAYNAADSLALVEMYDPDADYVSPHVKGLVAAGRRRLVANFRSGAESGGHIDAISILKIQLSCDLATILCRYEATNSGMKATGQSLLVVKKRGSGWRIVLHMTVV